MQSNRFGKRYCKVVLTGGPCAGKTTAQRQLHEYIAANHSEKWQSFIVSEASSILYKGGVHRSSLDSAQVQQWQDDMLAVIFQLESVFENIALNEQKRHTLIICDRGGLDPKVFTSSEDSWLQILSKRNINEQDILNRYDSVIQLFTAPKEYYNIDENPSRRETYAEAHEINKKYGEVWKGHSRLHQIDNYDHNDPECRNNLGWETKFAKVVDIIKEVFDRAEDEKTT